MRTRLVASLAVVAVLGVACGNSGGDDAAEGAGATAEAGTGATGAATDGSGGAEEFVPVDAPGVTDDEIRVTTITSTTNPLGGKYEELNDGLEAYFAKVSSEGGIHGRDLVVVNQRDDQVAKNQQEVQAALSQDDPFAVAVGSLLFTGAPLLVEEGVPTFGWNIGPEWNHENMFGNEGALSLDTPDPITAWPIRELGAEQIAVLGYGVSESSVRCAERNRTTMEQWPVAEVAFFDASIPFGVTDLSAQVAKMKEAGVDVVTTCMDLNGVFTLAKEMDKQDLDAVQIHYNAYDQEFMAKNGEFFAGDLVIPRFLAFEREPRLPEQEEFFRWMEEIGKTPVELSMIGWIAGRLLHEGLRRAGPDFDRQKVIDALNRVTDWTAGGILAPIDWTTGHVSADDDITVAGESCVNFTRVEGGELVPAFGEPGKPWVCLPREAQSMDEAVYKSFAEG